MGRYASQTTVSEDRSRAEIERTLTAFGAKSFSYAWDEREDTRYAMVGFRMLGRVVRFELPMPAATDSEFTKTPTGLRRAASAAQKEWEKACRARWRSLALVIKAKLVAIEDQVTTFEEEFLAHIVLPDGTTVGKRLLPEIAQSYASNQTPRLLLGSGVEPLPCDDAIEAEIVEDAN